MAVNSHFIRLSMTIDQLKLKLLSPERRVWIRVVESFFALVPAWTSIVGLAFFEEPTEIYILKIASWGSIISSPFLAFLMYRDSDLSKLERLAILVLLLSAALALLVGHIESGRI